jgi:hypothetical protein
MDNELLARAKIADIQRDVARLHRISEATGPKRRYPTTQTPRESGRRPVIWTPRRLLRALRPAH